MSKFNLIPQIEVDWAGYFNLINRIAYVLIAINVLVIAYCIATI